MWRSRFVLWMFGLLFLKGFGVVVPCGIEVAFVAHSWSVCGVLVETINARHEIVDNMECCHPAVDPVLLHV